MPDGQQHSIGRFEITAEIGRGSMGIVHRAHDPLMGRDVAVKTVLLPHGLTPDKRQEFHERFLREARAAGALSHPGIVTVYDFNDGVEGGSPFIAMEYVPGRTLDDLICAEAPLDPAWALTMGMTLADALQTAHAAGIVHRDLKPANILVRDTDRAVKIGDFGVARVNRSELTAAGSTYGSPSYIAPECLRGSPADARSDLFALAVILYEVLCRHRPFGGDDFVATCMAILTAEPPSIRCREPNLAPAFDRFFARALAKDPEARFQSGAEFGEALRVLDHEQRRFEHGDGTRLVQPLPEVMPGGEAEARVVGPSRRLHFLAAAITLALALVVGARWAGKASTDADASPSAASQPAGTPRPTTKPKAVAAPAAPPAASVKSVAKPARLDLRVKRRARTGGALTLFVDGKTVYATTLVAEPPPPKGARRDATQRDVQETSAIVDVPAGAHALMARLVTAGGESRTFEQSLLFEIKSGTTRRLTVTTGRKLIGPPLTLKLE